MDEGFQIRVITNEYLRHLGLVQELVAEMGPRTHRELHQSIARFDLIADHLCRSPGSDHTQDLLSVFFW